MATRTPLAPSHGAGGVFCVEAIGPGPRRPAPHRGAARAASAHGAKRRHRPPTPRGYSGGRARLAHRRSSRCSQKSGDRPTKTRSFCAITPRFLHRGGSAAAKGRKAARNHGHNRRKDENINFSSPNHQQKHVFTPCTSGEMQAEIRTFRRLGRKQGNGVFILFQGFANEKQKRIDNAQEAAPQIVHFHASAHSLCPIIQRLPAPTLKINALSFRFVGHNGQSMAASGAQFPVFSASSTTKSGYFTSEGR